MNFARVAAQSQRTCAALSFRFLIPLLTVRAAAFGGNPLERPRGPRGRCGQLLRGPFRANANSAAFDARNHEPAEVNHDGPHPCRDHRFHVRGARDRRRFFGRLETGRQCCPGA